MIKTPISQWIHTFRGIYVIVYIYYIYILYIYISIYIDIYM